MQIEAEDMQAVKNDGPARYGGALPSARACTYARTIARTDTSCEKQKQDVPTATLYGYAA